jgi:hypothetical protein
MMVNLSNFPWTKMNSWGISSVTSFSITCSISACTFSCLPLVADIVDFLFFVFFFILEYLILIRHGCQQLQKTNILLGSVVAIFLLMESSTSVWTFFSCEYQTIGIINNTDAVLTMNNRL